VKTLWWTPESLPFSPLQLDPLVLPILVVLSSRSVLGAQFCRLGCHGDGGGSFSFDDLCPHLRDQPSRPHDVHDAREIVGKHVQGHLGGHAWQRLHQEVGSSHPGLDRPEGMLDPLTPLAHLQR
jgi:hypothetical protein